MHSFNTLVLAFFHLIYSFLSALSLWLTKIIRRGPLALDAPRNRIPRHLAILFQLDDDLDIDTAAAVLIKSIEEAVIWCRTVGIERLTAYDNKGVQVMIEKLYAPCSRF
jgi:dehydrodolichyl diphosphate syntase complex subunit NUS1